ncbi:MAG: glycosyltransferase [Myxococcaceae bacterium]
MAVHQLLPSFKAGDATGQAALHFQWLLRRLGHFGEIYAEEIGTDVAGLARPVKALAPQPDDWVLYHHGIASGLTTRLVTLQCQRGVVFHNVSPARFYENTGLAHALRTARAQLAALAPHAQLGIGVSEYNTRELQAAGFRHTAVVHLCIEPERFSAAAADPTLSQSLGTAKGPRLLSVSRVVPHKRVEDLLTLHSGLLARFPNAELWIVGGYDAGSAHFRALRKGAASLRGVRFFGRLKSAELVSVYRAATLFVSMSEHEGFGVPLIEAMAANVPVLAYAAAAVPETLGGAGVAFTAKYTPALVELVAELHEDASLRQAILSGQQQRLSAFSPEAAQAALARALFSAPRPTPGPKLRPKPWARGAAKPRVGIVVQRFGTTGGAERHAQLVAERLAADWQLTVLTSCAKDHLTWDNVFPEGEHDEAGLRVHRFRSTASRAMSAFNALSRERFASPIDRAAEEHWVVAQGPRLPGLYRHLAESQDYDAFVFFTYLYAPTVFGLPLVASRSILVPTAHDEPPLKFGVYDDVFGLPRALFCNTPEEADLIRRRFPGHAPISVVGVGIDDARGDGARFRNARGAARPYLLYVGRLEEGKGVGELVRWHERLWKQDPSAPELFLAGEPAMRLSERPGLRLLGRISETDKADALAGALAAVIPSRFESLSLLALEAFAQGTPIVANQHSEVLVGQAKRSQAGLVYSDFKSFTNALENLGPQRETLSRNAIRFAQQHAWPHVLSTYRNAVDRIVAEAS